MSKKLKMMIAENPHASGANNHMGSRFTRDCTKMEAVLKILRQNNLFFVDSLTTADSCGYRSALKIKLSTAKNDLFLDNRDEYSYIRDRMEELKGIARKNGTAIGIGHIHKHYTIKVLNDIYPYLKAEGFELIFASGAVR